jgi:hypothetical protein
MDFIIFEKNLCPVFSINDNPDTTYYSCEGVIAVGEIKSTLNNEDSGFFGRSLPVSFARDRVFYDAV